MGNAAASAMAAAIVASSLVPAMPADAVVPKASLFGLGSDAISDAYNQNDADAISPYSQFSNPKDAIYKDGADMYKTSNKKNIERGFKRLESIPALLKANSPTGVMQSLQSNDIARSIEYMSLPEGSPAWQTREEIVQTIGDLGAFSKFRKFKEAKEYYDVLQSKIAMWKTQVNYDKY